MPTTHDPIDVFQYYEMKGPDECWPYLGHAWNGKPHASSRSPFFMANGKRKITYRWIYELVHGVTLTSDQLVIHSCDNGGYPVACGNPAHMRIGTHDDNMQDRTDRARQGMPHDVVRAIRKLLDEGREQQEIANLYGIARETVSAIATQRNHKTVV